MSRKEFILIGLGVGFIGLISLAAISYYYIQKLNWKKRQQRAKPAYRVFSDLKEEADPEDIVFTDEDL